VEYAAEQRSVHIWIVFGAVLLNRQSACAVQSDEKLFVLVVAAANL
jgi:hypothetical protein